MDEDFLLARLERMQAVVDRFGGSDCLLAALLIVFALEELRVELHAIHSP